MNLPSKQKEYELFRELRTAKEANDFALASSIHNRICSIYFRRCVVNAVEMYTMTMRGHDRTDMLFDYASKGFLNAIKKFDPASGNRFTTLAYRCVRNEMHRTSVVYRSCLRRGEIVRTTYSETIAAVVDRRSTQEYVAEQDILADFKTALPLLPVKFARLLTLYFIHKLTLVQLSKHMRVSKERVRQYINKGIDVLKLLMQQVNPELKLLSSAKVKMVNEILKHHHPRLKLVVLDYLDGHMQRLAIKNSLDVEFDRKANANVSKSYAMYYKRRHEQFDKIKKIPA